MEPPHRGAGPQRPVQTSYAVNPPATRRLDGKDLVIRMLAEVFQVEQSQGGQVRWQQVSSSLVPVSLYSRTTQRWLDWLLAASDCCGHQVSQQRQVKCNSAAMSPDSRDFLLLLQQFHQRQFSQHHQQQEHPDLQEQPVVFQVVAHDFFEGQCRKILNVKLAQPGTRLGQASDYFVYWKEPSGAQLFTPRRLPLQSSSSFNSNVGPNLCYQQFLAQQQQQQFVQTPTMTTATMTSTWGLNFASVNDARLFYDICSLNSVDLNFNSDYLKQLQLRQQQQRQQQQPPQPPPQQVSSDRLPPEVEQFRGQQKEQRIIRDFLDYKQRQLPAAEQHQQQRQRTTKHEIKRQPNRCPACRRQACQQQFSSAECPLHSVVAAASAAEEQQRLQRHRMQSSGSMRVRSRSSTRQANKDDKQSLRKQQRSFSTPPSPEHLAGDNVCPVHQQQQHHPLCMSLAATGENQTQLRPKKPARGELRDFTQQQQQVLQVPQTQQFSGKHLGLNSGNGAKQLALKQQSSETTLLSYNMCSRESWPSKDDNKASFSAHESQYTNTEAEALQTANDSRRLQDEQDAQQSARFATSRAAQRRSTGIDPGTNVDHFHNSLVHRNARLARAQYANSKNMKEFLSLDANGGGGSKSTTPTDERFNGTTSSREPIKSARAAKALPALSTAAPRGLQAEDGGEQRQKYCMATVATTTDDLPLDPSTKKRMFRLTSDEAISERTEPKSLSPARGSSAPSRQMRAVSLGPVEAEREQKRVRCSPASARRRRRSLERSVCVDLQESSQSKLSPLIQSAAPKPKRARTRSSCCARPRPTLVVNGLEPIAIGSQPIVSFKSAPDVRLEEAMMCRVGPTTCGGSYAVPLCDESYAGARDLYGRKSLSCPNSLRRRAQKSDCFHQQHNCCSDQSPDLAKHNYQATTLGLGNKSLGEQHLRRCQMQCANESGEPNATRTLRPFSSQSCRSPLHFGLYESEAEDEGGDDDDDTCQWRRLGAGYCCHRSSGVAALGRCAGSPRPVQGYDQTMARASLRSRQRAKSQPPPGEGVQEEQELELEEQPHLSKSVENVRKLIREVQKELDLLRAQPLSLNLRQAGQLRPNTGAGQLPHQQRQLESVAPKMLQEERNQQASYQMPLEHASCNHNRHQKPPTSATRPARHFKCVGAIRKAGFLSVKKWILKRRQSIELARKQGWKRYWVCLKGTALLFHSVIDDDHQDGGAQKQDHIDLEGWIAANCSSTTNLPASIKQQSAKCYIEREPRHLIIVEGAIAQPIPEHPKRDFVFCLSTTFGDAYLFQASCQLESDNWISAIHNACAASIARHLTRDEAVKLFETKIRHLELEADKKVFLRQRLESRLTSMSSIGHTLDFSLDQIRTEMSSNKHTMSLLLHRLQQQLLALDTYIEQIHCEAYQLRCYLSSCAHQHLFYQAFLGQRDQTSSSQATSSIELPHPKSLLTHVSKATKLVLIKLGVFTVSSFHAYVHARQSGAEANLVQTTSRSGRTSAVNLNTEQVELRVRSQSISEKLLNKTQNLELEKESEQLIHLSDLRRVPIKINRKLWARISNSNHLQDSDDRYSFHQDDGGQNLFIHLKLHQSSSSIMIIKQLLKILEPNLDEINCLDYYLQLSPIKLEKEEDCQSQFYVAKPQETLTDWGQQFEYLELFEKIIFKVQLTRKRMDEDEATPFGIAIGAQLFTCDLDSVSVLIVHCSYIEWGSVADKAGLRDDDELLMINGVPMMDLDMMFVECLIHDETQLKLVVRSSRNECPPEGQQVDKFTWGPPPTNHDGDPSNAPPDQAANGRRLLQLATSGSQIISDEYLMSLVCPPPPSHSTAFLRQLDSSDNLWRQKSDLTCGNVAIEIDQHQSPGVRLVSSATNPALARANDELDDGLNKAKSQQQLLDLSLIEDELQELVKSAESELYNEEATTNFHKQQQQTQQNANDDCNDLASQLLEKAEQLSRLLGKSHWKALGEEAQEQAVDSKQQQQLSVVAPNDKPHQNQIFLERLKRSILELLETEYAYIKQLETIREQYLIPLEESKYLGIVDLEQLNQVVLQILLFQREFFYKLTSDISDRYEWNTATGSTKLDEDYEELNKIVERLEQFKSLNDYEPMLRSIKETFVAELGKFKIYSSYCVTYSRLQKFLHPKLRDSNYNQQHQNGQQQQQVAVASQLDTFLSTNNLVVLTGTNSSHHHHRDFFKPLGSFRASPTNENLTKLKQLNEFLANLDSSSSSASISLTAKSDLSQQLGAVATSSEQPKKISIKNPSNNSATGLHHNNGGQKSVHQQNLESYLIKPIQRIVKYPMLLNSIAISVAQQNAEKSDEVHSELEVAVREMGAITSLVNDTQRISDEYGQSFELIERQYLERQQAERAKLSGSHSPSLVQQPTISLRIEHLLYFGQVEWLNIQEFNSKFKRQQTSQVNNLIHMLFVFESCVVLITKEQVIRPGSNQQQAKKKTPTGSFAVSNKLNQQAPPVADVVDVIRYQTLIPVKEVQVRSVPFGNSSQQQLLSANKQQAINDAQSTYLWELFRCSSVNSNSNLLTKSTKRRQASGKVYLLANSTNDIRNAFLRKIRFIIRESVRNMNLPPARSPSVKSLTPKKLSSPSSNTNSSCSQSTSLSPIGNSNEGGMVKEVNADGGCKLTTTTQQAVDGTYTTSIQVNN